MKIKTRELGDLGVPYGRAMHAAMKACGLAIGRGDDKKTIEAAVAAVLADPAAYAADALYGELAAELAAERSARGSYRARTAPAPWKQWGRDLDAAAIKQLEQASMLPVSVAGALMPDAHVGYGLPIGGVLATEGAVIPKAVGVDIACRMRLSVLDLPTNSLAGQAGRLRNALLRETCFGVGAGFSGADRREHAVMDEDWTFSGMVASTRDRAWTQLGSSGSGNHFVEFGTLTLERAELGLEAGEYLALLSHSGSRGAGGLIAEHFSRLATEQHAELPRDLIHLAWLDLSSEAGQEYWAAMELMGRYAAANHELIHKYVTRAAGAKVLAAVENHHNFAWLETHGGRQVVVHRKGATPAGPGVLGVIPGSMGTPGYVVRGKGCPESLESASHGAGRRMSRKAASEQFTWSAARKFLDARGVELISAGLDEVPMAYKDIEAVMAAQADLVEPIARFHPRLVRMAPAGERAED